MMRYLLLLVVCGAVLFTMGTSHAKPSGVGTTGDGMEIRRDFEGILDLWRAGRYNELYERTYGAGKHSRESFARRMSDSERKPVCCWDKIQEVKVTLKNGTNASLHARIGLEGTGAATDYCTRTFSLRKVDGIWKASVSDILALAGNSGKKRRFHR
jgi:hypothetical protein